MAHQQPPQKGIFKYRVPVPADPKAEQEYLDLGWIHCGDELMWSHAKGTPRHPGEHLDVDFAAKWGRSPTASLLQLLPVAILVEGLERLPPAADCEADYLEVPVMVLIKYRRSTTKKGKSRHSFWTADDAKLVALAAEPPKDQAATACE